MVRNWVFRLFGHFSWTATSGGQREKSINTSATITARKRSLGQGDIFTDVCPQRGGSLSRKRGSLSRGEGLCRGNGPLSRGVSSVQGGGPLSRGMVSVQGMRLCSRKRGYLSRGSLYGGSLSGVDGSLSSFQRGGSLGISV